MIEMIKEITASMKQNKLRTGLTGFSVAWGIFMLIILLGAGNGLENGVSSNFEGQDINTIYIYPSRTQEAYKGYNRNRRIKLKYNDVEYLKKHVANIGEITSTRYLYGNISYGAKNTFTSTRIDGTSPRLAEVEGIDILEGRFLNDIDMERRRKVVALNKYAADALFKGESSIGKIVIIDNINYRVVGVTENRGFGGSNANVYMPITTSLVVYNISTNNEISNHIVEVKNVNNVEQSKVVEAAIRKAMANKHSFSQTDTRGVYLSNSIEQALEAQMIFGGISTFIWIIGLGTLMAGIVGVSNIMLVTVRERTNEFGIRKSMGATPSSLVRLILIEAVAITMLFGYAGLVGGTFVMEMVNVAMEMMPSQSDPNSPAVFKNPTIDLSIAFNATVVLVIAGTVAGYIPARRAAKLKTIDAMRYGK